MNQKKKRKKCHINPEDGLEAAILKVAKYDYIDALIEQMEDRECEITNRRARRLERFFLSPWGQSLSYNHGELIIERCRQDAKREVAHNEAF